MTLRVTTWLAGQVAITASQLQKNVYRILDQVLETGAPVEIEHAGRRLRITAISNDRLERLESHSDAVGGDPADLDRASWNEIWSA